MLATGAASAKTKACTGTPLVVQTIGNLSVASGGLQPVPEVPAGATAAAAAVTKTCELGAPVAVKSCDDISSPNGDAACGQQAASNKALFVDAYSSFGDSYGPVAATAGIPFLPINATSATENTNSLSFPMGYPITSLVAQIQLAHSA